MSDHSKAGFANAELHRQFNALVLTGTVATVDTAQNKITMNISTAAGEIETAPIRVLGRAVSRISLQESGVVISPRGDLSQAFVILDKPDPLLEQLEKIQQLQSQN